MYYTYMIRCADNSIYTGITTDLERRTNEHLNKLNTCAKYTKSHTAIKLELAWKSENKSLASKLEYQIKHLTKTQKENLLASKNLDIYLRNKIDVAQYQVIDFNITKT